MMKNHAKSLLLGKLTLSYNPMCFWTQIFLGRTSDFQSTVVLFQWYIVIFITVLIIRNIKGLWVYFGFFPIYFKTDEII